MRGREVGGVAFSYRAKVVTVCVIVALALVFLYSVREILSPFIWAAIVAYVFNPLVTAFSRRMRVPRFWGVALVYAVMAAVVAWAAIFVVPLWKRESEQFSQDLPRLIESLYLYLVGQEMVEILGFRIEGQSVAREIAGSLQTFSYSASGYVLPVFFGVLGFLTKALLFIFGLFYFLLEADRIGDFLKRLLPPSIEGEILGVCADIDDVLGRWVRGQLLLVLIMGSVTWVALTLLGVRYAIVLAIITGVLEIFPVVGPVAAGTIACVVALFQPNPFGWSNITYVAVIAAVYFVLRHAEDYFVIPNIIGRIVQFHPLAVLFAVFAGGSIAGILGMFIAAPLLAMIKIVLRYLYGKLVEAPLPAPHTPAAVNPDEQTAPARELAAGE